MPRIRILCAVLLLAGLWPFQAAAALVVFAKGDVTLTVGGQTQRLRRGMEIGSEVATVVAHQGFAQIRLDDGRLVGVRPGERYELSASRTKAQGRDENAQEDLAAQRLKALLRKASGASARASRATLPETLQAAGEASEGALISSLNLVLPDAVGAPAPAMPAPQPVRAQDYLVSFAGVTAGDGAGMTAPALSNGVLLSEHSALERVIYLREIGREDGSSVYPLDAITAGSLPGQQTDPATGITWGRWDSGEGSDSATFREFDLADAPLHALVSNAIRGDGEASSMLATPLTGTVDYVLIGGTHPTDNQGHEGVLGSATLQVDFEQSTVAASVALSIAQVDWSADGNGLLSEGNLFSGDFATVRAGEAAGQGEFAGFVQNGADFDPAVAGGGGFAYRLESAGTRVGGVAVFVQQ